MNLSLQGSNILRRVHKPNQEVEHRMVNASKPRQTYQGLLVMEEDAKVYKYRLAGYKQPHIIVHSYFGTEKQSFLAKTTIMPSQ
jgi:hypothetical protein